MSHSSLDDALSGSLTVVLRGEDVPSGIGRLQHAGVKLRHVHVGAKTARCTIRLRDFDVFYRTCRKHRLRFRIEARHGMPFWRRRLWRRKAFVFGAVAFVCIVYTLSSVIWRVDMTGPKDEDGLLQLQDAVKSAGVSVGQARNHLADPTELATRILSRAPDFVWVGVQTTGSVATIQAIPKVAGTKPLNEEPHNIVATQPAVIRKISASRGRVVVKENQYVHPGQILISGVLSEDDQRVPAAGVVTAEVWYSTKVEVPLRIVQAGLTGESVERNFLYIGGLRLRVWGFKEPHFASSYERDKGTDWHLGNYILPIQWQHTRLYKVTASEQAQSEVAAKAKASQLAISDVNTQTGGEGKVLGQSVLHQQVAHGTLYETVLTRVEQKIGVPSAIPPSMAPSDETNGPHA